MDNYLSQRNQYVQFNDTKSDLKTMLCGIPQGSILGPILFLLYINDLANISDKLKFILFADDTNVFYSDNDLNKVFNVLNDELKHLCIWFKVNKLSLNVGKINFRIFNSKGEDDNYNVKIDGIDVNRVQIAKFLGVLIDDKLT